MTLDKNRKARSALAAGAAALVTIGAGATSASAAPPAGGWTLAQVQQAGAAATARRISSLDTAIPKITNNEYLTAAHRAEILGVLNGDLAGMQSLSAKIAADTVLAQAIADYRSIFTEYRVYAVALPQAHYAAAADALTDDAIPHLTAAQAKLAALLAGPDKGKNTPELKAELADMLAKVNAAAAAINGVAAGALSVTPAQYDANHAVLQGYRDSVRAALADVASARADGAAIVAALR